MPDKIAGQAQNSARILVPVFIGNGGIAQLVERLVRNEKARGSNPLTSNPLVVRDLHSKPDELLRVVTTVSSVSLV
jgi:hypothetical protein